MPIEEIEREIHDAYLRLAESVTSVRYCHEHYLDHLAVPGDQQARPARPARGLIPRQADADAAHEAVIATARAAHDQATGDLPGTITALTADHPWALAGFGDPCWDFYSPDLQAPSPTGVRA